MNTLAKWSVNDYHRMIEVGILRDRRVELLASEIIEMSLDPIHYSTVKRNTKYLEELLVGTDIRFNVPITLSDSEPEPDIAVVRLPEYAYSDHHPRPDHIFLLIEVAKTSLKKDLDLKASIYATAEIQEYWVLDLSGKQMVVFQEPQNGQYPLLTTADKFAEDNNLARGVEPDSCFYIQNVDLILGKKLDIKTAPPPDLALEVDISSSSQRKFGIYLQLQIPEVWRYSERQGLVIYQLQAGEYVECEFSPTFPMVFGTVLKQFLQLADTEDDNSIIRTLREWLKK